MCKTKNLTALVSHADSSQMLTRMHSSRMRIARFNGYLGGRGVSAKGVVCLAGARGVCLWEVVCPEGVCPGGCTSPLHAGIHPPPRTE